MSLPAQLREVAKQVRTAAPQIEAERQKRAARIAVNLINLSVLTRMVTNAR